jgi:hypothetical protein
MRKAAWLAGTTFLVLGLQLLMVEGKMQIDQISILTNLLSVVVRFV